MTQSGHVERVEAQAEARFRRVAEVFDDLRRLPSAEREPRLATLCGEDVELQLEVRSLLSHHEASGDTLDRGVLRPSDGARIGRYRIDGRLGEGGMGTVYRATQLEPVRREVALKVIKLGMDTRQVVRRFELERQTLARLDHPHIAKVLDGGATHDGRPYFVMELVSGLPITSYCDSRQLEWRARVRLLIDVCAAVHHAHQRGILHRDIKPSNVLVGETDGDAVAKVIDFGVAKALLGNGAHQTAGRTHSQASGLTGPTAAGHVVGTPDYMSPEQADGADVDTRTDVYALGVLLFELLVGLTPLSARSGTTSRTPGAAERRRRQSHDLAPKPSHVIDDERAAARASTAAGLRKALRGDLDCILLKALARDPAMRYASVAAFADDLERSLRHEPIAARPPSAAYLLTSFARRHTVVLGAATLVALSLIVGTAVSLYSLGVARSERDASRDAEREQKRLADALGSQLFASDIERGRQAVRQGRWWEANELLINALRAQPDSPHARWAMREMVWAQGRLAMAPLAGGGLGARFLPDADRVIVTAKEQPPMLFDLLSGETTPLGVSQVHVWDLDVSPDGRWLVTVDTSGSVERWDLTDPSISEPTVLAQCAPSRGAVRCSREGNIAYVGGRSGIVWKIDLDEPRPTPIAIASTNSISRMALSPDGTIAVGTIDGSITLVRPDGSAPRTFTPHDRPIQSLAFGKGGRWLASGTTAPTVLITDIDDGSTVHSLTPRTGTARDMRFGPDDRTLLILGWWSLAEVTLEDESVRPIVPISGWRFDRSADGRYVALASGGAGSASIWDISPDRGSRRGVAPPRSVVRPTGCGATPYIAARAGTVMGIDERGRAAWQMPASRVRTFATSPDGRWLATVSPERTLRVYDLTTHALVGELTAERGNIRIDDSTIAFDRDGNVYVGTANDAVVRFSPRDGTVCPVLPPCDRELLAVAVTSNGRWVAACERNGRNHFVNLETGEYLRETSHSTGFAVSFTSDDAQCVIGNWNGDVHAFDIATRSWQTMRGHSARISAVNAHPFDPNLILTSSEDGTLRVWHLGLHREVAEFAPFGGPSTLRVAGFVEDGNGIAAVGSDGDLAHYSIPLADSIIDRTPQIEESGLAGDE